MQIRSFLKWFGNMKLAHKLIISNVIVVILPVLILGKISYDNYLEQLKDQARQDAQTQLVQRVSQIKEKLHAVENFSSNIAHSYFVTHFLDGSFLTGYEDIMNYSFLDKYIVSTRTANGSLINTLSIFYTNPDIPEKWPVFYHLSRLDNSILEKYGINIRQSKWLSEKNISLKGIEYYDKRYFIEKNEIVFIKPIVSEFSSSLIGLVKTGVLIEKLFSSLESSEDAPIGFIAVDKAGNIVYNPDKANVNSVIPVIQKNINSVIFPDSATLLLIEPIKELEIRIVARYDISNTLNKAAKTSLSVLWIIMRSVAFSCCSVYLIVHLLLKKMKKMINVMRTISEGDFSQRVCINTSDEFGMLSSSFDRMIDNVVNLQGAPSTNQSTLHIQYIGNFQIQIGNAKAI